MQTLTTEATGRIYLNLFGCLGICYFFDVDHVIAACVLFDFRIGDILGYHFLCGASSTALAVCFQTQWKIMTNQ